MEMADCGPMKTSDEPTLQIVTLPERDVRSMIIMLLEARVHRIGMTNTSRDTV